MTREDRFQGRKNVSVHLRKTASNKDEKDVGCDFLYLDSESDRRDCVIPDNLGFTFLELIAGCLVWLLYSI